MAASPLFDQLVTGVVSAVNEKGLRLEGQEGWFNFSRFAVGLLPPGRGETVTLTLDKAGFVRAIQPAEDGPAAIPSARPPRIDAQRVSAAVPSAKDRTITRLAVLKAAAEFGAARPEVRARDVLVIADVWERWIMREPAEPADQLDEAF